MTHDPVQELLDIEAIKQLKARYFRLLDAKDWEAFVEIFTEDVELLYSVPEEQFVPPGAVTTPDGMRASAPRPVVVLSAPGRPGDPHLPRVPHA